MRPVPLQVVAPVGKTPLTPTQQRFNALVREVAQTRDTLAAWRDATQVFRSEYAKRVAPLEAQLDAQRRQWALALDALTRQAGWSRVEIDTMSGMIADLVFGLLLATPEDAALRAMFAEHAGREFDAVLRERRRQAAAGTDASSEPATEARADADAQVGSDSRMDPDPRPDTRSRSDAPHVDLDEAYAWRGPSHTPPRRRSAAERRRDAEAKQATQSVRDVYRKLASALHPDREPDPAQREIKNGLMQQANQAHAANDLLALLELQWQVAQLDLKGLAETGSQRLKQYNVVLTEQLASLKASVAEAAQSLRREFGLAADLPLHPGKLEGVLRGLRAELADAVAGAKQVRAQLNDPAWVRAWLKHERRRG